MGNTVENRVKNVMSAVLEIPEDQIKNDSSPDKIESWDSLKHMNLVIAIEEEFEIEITEKNINNFGSVKNILNEINHL